jgi:hypothetical protein
MKKLLLISSLLSATLINAANTINMPMTVVPNATTISNDDKELQWVDEKIKAILPARIGVADGFINSLIDPVKYTKPISTKISASNLLAPPKLGSAFIVPKPIIEPLKLQAMMNKSVLINGTWYKLNDTVREYRLAEIKANSVLLNGKKGQSLILFLTRVNNKITINTK